MVWLQKSLCQNVCQQTASNQNTLLATGPLYTSTKCCADESIAASTQTHSAVASCHETSANSVGPMT